MRMELSTRDVVARAIATEIANGQGHAHGGVYLDVTHLPREQIETRLPVMLEQFLKFGMDIRKKPMEVAPTAHHIMGGLRITPECFDDRPGICLHAARSPAACMAQTGLGEMLLPKHRSSANAPVNMPARTEKRVKKIDPAQVRRNRAASRMCSFAGQKTRRGSGKNSNWRCGREPGYSGTRLGSKMRLQRQTASSGRRLMPKSPQESCGMLYCREHVPDCLDSSAVRTDPARIPGGPHAGGHRPGMGRGAFALRPHLHLATPQRHQRHEVRHEGNNG